MDQNFEHMDGLIARALAGEAGREEVDRLEDWINEHPGHKDYFNQNKRLLEAISESNQEHTVDVDAAWNKLNTRLEAHGKEAKVVPVKKPLTILKAAAGLFLAIGLVFLVKLFFYPNAEAPLMYAANTKAIEQKLPDGTKVMINKNSEISYVAARGRREVKLKGEAYFEVVHNEQEPFVITVGEVSIQDIGTAFNVKAIPGSNIVEVMVEEGEVSFYTHIDPGMHLMKGEKAVYDLSAKNFVKQAVDPTENTGSYHSKMFYFKESALKEVLAQINAVYESDIRLSDDSNMANCRLSVEFHNEDLDMIVSVIAETLDLEVERTGDTITLKGGACPE